MSEKTALEHTTDRTVGISIDSVRLPVPPTWALVKDSPGQRVYTTSEGDVVSVDFFAQRTQLPFGTLDDVDIIRRYFNDAAKRDGAACVSAEVLGMQGLRVLKTIIKMKNPPQVRGVHGLDSIDGVAECTVLTSIWPTLATMKHAAFDSDADFFSLPLGCLIQRRLVSWLLDHPTRGFQLHHQGTMRRDRSARSARGCTLDEIPRVEPLCRQDLDRQRRTY